MTTLDVVNSDKRVELVSTHVEDSEKSHKTSIRSNLKGDYGNIGILLFLYLLQGVPLGIIIAVPMLLQNRGVSYKDQASVSFSMWPFAREFKVQNYLKEFLILNENNNIWY